jgi:maltooligosyltrehalose synthase
LPPGLAGRPFTNVLTGERVVAAAGVLPLARLFARFPVALLHSRPE